MEECISVREMGPRTLRDQEMARILQKQINEELQKEDENMARQMQEMEDSPRSTAERMSSNLRHRGIQDTTPESSSNQPGDDRPCDSSSRKYVGRRLEFGSHRSNRGNIQPPDQPADLHTASRGDGENELENSPDTTPESSTDQSGDRRPRASSYGRSLQYDPPWSNRRNISPLNRSFDSHTASRGDGENRRNRDVRENRGRRNVGNLAALFERRISDSGGSGGYVPMPRSSFPQPHALQPGQWRQADDVDLNDYEANWELGERIGVVNNNIMPQKDIDRLPVYHYKGPSASSDTDSDTCAVCTCQFQLTDTLRTLPCFHRFHPKCVDRWLRENAKCPVCRKSTKLKMSKVK